MRRRVVRLVTRGIVIILLAPSALSAQGGGASQTGAIEGRVTDMQGAALTGVTVAATSPTQIGISTTVTNDAGFYRFPAMAPGRYSLQYERAGFSAVTRADIDIAIGFTARVDVALPLASLQTQVVIAGETPLVDTAAGRVQVNFTRDDLGSLPTARDLWGVLAVTPGLQMGRFDIGGNRSGNQASYRAYGYGGQDQQVRILVEGINTTDGRGNNGFFQDYGSLQEVFVAAVGNGAEMPTPGVMTQMIARSGGNTFHGELYTDYANNALQSVNISADLVARGIAEHGNEIRRRIDTTVDAGGPLRQDRLWYYASYRQLTSAIDQLNFRFDQTFDTTLYNATAKGTYRLAPHHQLIGYYQWGKKTQPYRQWSATYNFSSAADTTRQDDGSWIWKGEWNGVLSRNLYAESRYGVFGYFLPLIGNSDEPFRQDTATRVSTGGDRRTQTDRDRKQWTTAVTYFAGDAWHGSHTLKAGTEVNLETAWTGFERTRAGNVEHIFSGGRATQVIFGFPTADGALGGRGARDHLLSIGELDQISGFVADHWSVNDRLTINAGVRFERYHSHMPAQRQLAFTNGPIALPAETFPRQTFFRWHSSAPRVAVIYDLDGRGKTAAKLTYGYFGHNPSFDIATAANPNQGLKTITYTWTDRNGDRLYQPGEEGTSVTSNLAGAVGIDPQIEQPYSHEISAFFEREVAAASALRIGYIYKTNDDLWQAFRPLRPTSGYTTPFLARDLGPDGAAGTADDRDLTFYGIPNAELGAPTAVIQNVPAFGRYKSLAASFDRRLRGRWALGAAFSHSWIHEHNRDYIGNVVSPAASPGYPNSPNEMLFSNGRDGANRFTLWDAKVHATWDAPLGMRLTPVVRAQAGQPYGRVLQVTAPASCACFFTGMVLVEPLDARRMDTVTVFDLRAEATVFLAGRYRARLFADVFNLFNTDAFDVISFTTGSAFALPTSIVGPRLGRIGVRVMF